jgi:hypothetical protein
MLIPAHDNTTRHQIRHSVVASCLFLVPIYLSTIEMVPAGIKQSTYLQFLLYPLLLAFAGSRDYIVGALLFCVVLAFNSFKERCGAFGEVFFESAKLSLYLFSGIIASKVSKPDDFIRAVVALSTISALVIIASFLLHAGTGFSIFSDGGYGKVRPHALVSEPSATAIPLSMLAVVAVVKRKASLLLLAVVACVMTQSVIAGLLVFVGTSIAVAGKFASGRVLLFSLLIAAPALLFFLESPDNFSFLATISPRLHTGLLAVSSGGEIGHNPRFITTQIILQQLRETGTLATGLGAEINSCLNEGLQWGYDANLLIFLVRSVGYLGVFAVACFLIFSTYRAAQLNDRGANYFIFPITVVVMVGVLINGAQGLLYFSFLAMLCFGIHRQWRQMRMPDSGSYPAH